MSFLNVNDSALDEQMEEIGKEEAALDSQIEELHDQLRGADSVSQTVSSAEALLAKLRKRLDQPISWELKRQLIEVLVAGIQVETTEVCGVKQARTTVTYRFSLPGEPAGALLPAAYSSARRVVRIPVEPKTVGDHIRLKRLSMKLTQEQVAERLGVTTASVYNWESDDSKPSVPNIPAIIEFLGYNPLPPATTLAGRLLRHRTSLGLPQSASARLIGVDPGTLARWERSVKMPAGDYLARVERFLAGATASNATLRRAG